MIAQQGYGIARGMVVGTGTLGWKHGGYKDTTGMGGNGAKGARKVWGLCGTWRYGYGNKTETQHLPDQRLVYQIVTDQISRKVEIGRFLLIQYFG